MAVVCACTPTVPPRVDSVAAWPGLKPHLKDYEPTSYVPNQLLVRLWPTTDFELLELRLVDYGYVGAARIGGDQAHLRELTFTDGRHLAEAFEALVHSGDVEFVEPNLLVEALDVVPTDPSWSQQWGPQKINAPKAWQLEGTDDVVVAVIDTGISYTHPELQNLMWRNPGEVPGNGVDDDHDGYIDDVYGYDFANDDGDPLDDHFHGSHCAGIIGAEHNGIGIAGLSRHVRFMALKFLAANGSGAISNAVRALDFAVAKGAKISNNSWGGGGYSASMHASLIAAEAAQHLFIAAAGNASSDNDAVAAYPANYPVENVISVGASTSTDDRASFSNWGATTVDLFAPGQSIYSLSLNGGYTSASGTSMAAPHVTGVAAMLRSTLGPNATYRELKSALLDSAPKVAALSGLCVTGGRLDANAALGLLDRVPPAVPRGLTAEADAYSGIVARWSANTEPDLAGYRLFWGVDPAALDAVELDAGVTEHRLAPVQSGATYTLRLAAVDRLKNASAASAPVTVLPRDTVAPAGVLTLNAHLPRGVQLPLTPSTSTGDYDPAWSFDKLADGDANTAWASPFALASREQLVELRFDRTRQLGQLRLYHGTDLARLFPEAFELEVSADEGRSWTSVVSEVGYVATPGTWGEWTFAAVAAERLRLRVTGMRQANNGLFYAVVSELQAFERSGTGSGVELDWVASGDDGARGRAARYELRWSQQPLTPETFALGTAVTPVPAPLEAGGLERLRVDGLDAEATYYFALEVIDDVGQRSPMSNVASVVTAGVAPGGVSDLHVASAAASSVTLAWTSPGDDGVMGRATRYDLRKSAAPIHSGNFLQASAVALVPAPAAPGSAETFQVTGLLQGQTYYFALRTLDEAGNASVLSNVARADTVDPADVTPPAAVGDLGAVVDAPPGALLPPVAVSASASYNAAWAPANANDGDLSTAWSTLDLATTPSASLVLDLGAPVAVGSVVLTPHPGLVDLFPSAFSVLGSVDGGAEVRLAERVGQPPPSGPLTVTLAPATARYLRLEVVAAKSVFGVEHAVLAEVQVRGPGAQGLEALARFTAPGDDGLVGVAAAYDLRWSEAPLDAAGFAAANRVSGLPAPRPAGSLEALRVRGLPGERTVYLALTSADDLGNVSALSNVATLATPAVPPGAVSDLVATGGDAAFTLSWHATGGDGLQGQAAEYDLRWSDQPIDVSSFDQATRVTAAPVPAPSGALEQVVLAPVPNQVQRWFALKVRDAAGNTSLLSNVATATSLDTVPPAAVPSVTLTLVPGTSVDQLRVDFAASGDDGLTGSAASYEVRWDVAASFASAQVQALPGSARSVVLSGLARETQWFVSVRALDERPNASAWSAPASLWTTMVPPTPIADLAASSVQPTSLVLGWTAPGDDGSAGPLTRYEVRRASSLTALQAGQGTVIGAPPPSAPNAAERFTVTGLTGLTTYWFEVRAYDDRDNSSVSNRISVTTADDVPPARTANLAALRTAVVGQVQLSWTAAGDDGASGTAASVELRYGPGPIDDASFASLPLVPGAITPQPGGVVQMLNVTLAAESYYCFALKTVDDRGLKSALSNVACSESGWSAPSRVADLRTGSVTGSVVGLFWTAPGDDGASGTATRYEVRYATSAITDSTWPAATLAAGAPAPRVSGSAEAFAVSGLAGATTYWFAVKAFDDKGLGGALSNVVSVRTADAVAPATVTDLSALATAVQTQVQLRWTQAGDNGTSGTAARVELRYATSPIDAASFPAATLVSPSPVPGPGGTLTTVTLSGLQLETKYWFALVTYDAAGNAAALSNVPTFSTAESPPARVTDLAATAVSDTSLRLTFTAPGASGTTGTATAYEVRWSPAPITAANFAAATLATGVPAPGPGGSVQTFAFAGLTGDTSFYVALRAIDERGNWSSVSNVATATTLDVVPPAAVSTLSAASGSSTTTVVLTWVAVGDNGTSGQARTYDVRYSTSALTAASFDAAPRFAVSLAAKPAGATETVTVSGLQPETAYWFAVKVLDEVPLTSAMSNVATTSTACVAPSAIADLRGAVASPTSVSLSFTAPGNNGASGTAAAYQVRYATFPIDLSSWALATPLASPPSPKPAGQAESVVVSGLTDDTTWYFAVRAVDGCQLVGALSNPLSVRTPDVTAPGQVTSLVAWSPLGTGSAVAFTSSAASSTHTAAWGVANAVDGNTGSAWASSQQPYDRPETLTVGWGSLRSIGSVKLTGAADYLALFPRDFELQLSEDGVQWTAVAREIAYTAQPGTNTWAFEAVTAQYLRVAISSTGTLAGQHLAMLAEVQVLESPPDPRRLTVRWLAPGDDGLNGRATSYELRYWLDGGSFATGTLAATPSAPSASGSVETYALTGLQPETRYALALVALDEAGNRSPVSNVASATTGASPPAQIRDLQLVASTQTTLRVSWTAPGEDGNVGTAASYDVRWSSSSLTAETFAQAQGVAGAPVPSPAGSAEQMTVSGLVAGTRYYVAVRAIDARGNVGPISNVLVASTAGGPDSTAPARIVTLAASPLQAGPTPRGTITTASGAQFPAGAAANLVDGDGDTDWATPARASSQAEQVVLDLGQVLAVGAVTVQASRAFPGLFPVDYVIETSTDGTTYATAATVQGRVAAPGEAVRHAFSSRPVRWVRLSISRLAQSSNGWFYCAAAELSVERTAPSGAVSLTWVATGDDGALGSATSYQVRYATAPLDAAGWATAAPATGAPSPGAPGSPEAMTVSGLSPGTTYWFGVVALDEAGNASPLSNVAVVLPN